MFETVLIANRGEIALRILRTLRRLGVRSVAVHSEPDRRSPHVTQADAAIDLGGRTAAESYLRVDAIVDAARQSGAQAVHPGYGFLSESAELAQACEANGLVFIGPTAAQIRAFGLKHESRSLAQKCGVPLTPGTGLLDSVEQACNEAEQIGYPVMLKSTAGGGGIGLSRCEDAGSLRSTFERVQRLGVQFFGQGGAFLERCVDQARHVEVQIFGDGQGKVVALGERDCSLQRRNQKVIEETPAPNLPEPTRAALQRAATRLGEAVRYRSAGTVEFIYDAQRDEFYFLEVNARLQVEHPVTELVTGVDLVECMLQLAAGDPVDWNALARPPRGAAIEVRLYAENPLRQFQPSPGVLTEVRFPTHARVDGWVETGTEVSAHYDPLLAKVIVGGRDRGEALRALKEALEQTRLQGIATNLQYVKQVSQDATFRSGEVTTRFLDRFEYRPQAVEVLEAGTQTTVQDHPGRVGYWNIGVPPSGPMDDYAFRVGNRIVGNPTSAAGLECTLQGPTLRFHCDTVIALTGAPCPATVDEEPVAFWEPVEVRAGATLKMGRVTSGCRTYLAIRRGIDVPLYLGSRSTFVLGEFGGHAGRILRPGDVLDMDVGTNEDPAKRLDAPQAAASALIPRYGTEWTIGVLDGPHGAPDFFTAEAIEEFFDASWTVHYNSNRLGVRLTGPKPSWARTDGGEAGLHPSNIHDCEYAIGSINFTGDSPVILTHDGPSLGGFVCPATIIQAELWKVGQLKPGDRIRFRRTDYDEAFAQLETQQRHIETLSVRPLPTSSREQRPTAPAVLSKASEEPSPAILVALPATAQRPRIVIRQAGDNYVLIEYGPNVLDLALRMRVHLLMEALQRDPIAGVLEVSPGVRSVQIRYDGRLVRQSTLLDRLLALEAGLPDVGQLEVPTRIVRLPLAFEDSATLLAVERYQQTVRDQAPWLPNNVDFIQRINGLDSRDQVRDIVYSARYLVLGLGDVYLGAPCAVPVDPRHRLLTSKYNPARTFTAEGTVGIGGVYMCIYGMDSPGGYQLVGRTLPIWNKFLKNPQFHAGQPWLLRFFDQVEFFPVEEAELTRWRDAFREGHPSGAIEIREERFSFARHRHFLAEHAQEIEQFRARQQSAFQSEVARWQADAVEESTAAVLAEVHDDGDADGHPVAADLCGNLWKIVVELGQRVEVGQELVVVEAMKMELTISAPIAGTVKAIRCQPGRPVNPGDTLVLLEPCAGPGVSP